MKGPGRTAAKEARPNPEPSLKNGSTEDSSDNLCDWLSCCRCLFFSVSAISSWVKEASFKKSACFSLNMVELLKEKVGGVSELQFARRWRGG